MPARLESARRGYAHEDDITLCRDVATRLSHERAARGREERGRGVGNRLAQLVECAAFGREDDRFIFRQRLDEDLGAVLVFGVSITTAPPRHDRPPELLDAAHLIPDSDPGSRPEVPNGLALYKLHHAAFDASLVGIRPDHVIEVGHDILAEIDGPMLVHARSGRGTSFPATSAS